MISRWSLLILGSKVRGGHMCRTTFLVKLYFPYCCYLCSCFTIKNWQYLSMISYWLLYFIIPINLIMLASVSQYASQRRNVLCEHPWLDVQWARPVWLGPRSQFKVRYDKIACLVHNSFITQMFSIMWQCTVRQTHMASSKVKVTLQGQNRDNCLKQRFWTITLFFFDWFW